MKNMIKSIIMVVLMLVLSNTINAQDTIVTKSNQTILCKITKVTSMTIFYTENKVGKSVSLSDVTKHTNLNTIVKVEEPKVEKVSEIKNNGFKWEKIDSTSKSKSQIYSDTKLFIAQTWNSAKEVIQNDDKENGNILIKGSTKQVVSFGWQPYTYYYHYSVTFLMKDNKVKIILDNVTCSTAIPPTGAKYTVDCIQPFEGENYPKWATLSKGKQQELMTNLKNSLQAVVDEYIQTIKKPSISNSGW